MAFNAFLKIDGIRGDSTDNKHQGWIEIESFCFGTDQLFSATEISAGHVNFDHLELSKLSDQASSKLMEFCAYGKHASQATLEVYRTGDQRKCLEVKMENVIVAAYRSHALRQPKDMSEEVELSFAKVEWTSRQPVCASVAHTTTWDLTANKAYA